IIPEGILVSSAEGEFLCSLKGALKQEKSRMKNLVAVGDCVRFEKSAGREGSIAKIEPRKSILSRADNLSRKKEQLIAVNIDQVFITASVVSPRLKPFLIDRYIIAAHKGNMEPILLINKIDLFDSPPSEIGPQELQEEKELYEELLRVYRDLGITTIAVSTETSE
ncbi:MAG: GTPase RsgA, partial [Chlamydiota bacterium]